MILYLKIMTEELKNNDNLSPNNEQLYEKLFFQIQSQTFRLLSYYFVILCHYFEKVSDQNDITDSL